MPKFLENKLKQEYGEKSAIPYKVMNKLGAMHGNKETAKGAAMEKKHEADMKTGSAQETPHEPMREMRIEIHRGPQAKVTGFTIHHHMMPKATKSMAFSENTTHSHPFGVGDHEAMMDHVHEHTAAQIASTDAGKPTPKEAPAGASAMEEEAEEGE